MIVLDANTLIRAGLGRRVRHLLEEYASREIRFYAPNAAFAMPRNICRLCLKKEANPPTQFPRRSSIFNYLSSQSIPKPMATSKKKRGFVCAVAMRTIGRYSRLL